jgi:hypothetical protein
VSAQTAEVSGLNVLVLCVAYSFHATTTVTRTEKKIESAVITEVGAVSAWLLLCSLLLLHTPHC